MRSKSLTSQLRNVTELKCAAMLSYLHGFFNATILVSLNCFGRSPVLIMLLYREIRYRFVAGPRFIKNSGSIPFNQGDLFHLVDACSVFSSS